jgi:hypothetical protein
MTRSGNSGQQRVFNPEFPFWLSVGFSIHLSAPSDRSKAAILVSPLAAFRMLAILRSEFVGVKKLNSGVLVDQFLPSCRRMAETLVAVTALPSQNRIDPEKRAPRQQQPLPNRRYESTSAHRRLHVQGNHFRIADNSGATGKTRATWDTEERGRFLSSPSVVQCDR